MNENELMTTEMENNELECTEETTESINGWDVVKNVGLLTLAGIGVCTVGKFIWRKAIKPACNAIKNRKNRVKQIDNVEEFPKVTVEETSYFDTDND